MGPFVPQRFEPPADAWCNEARGVRQIGDAELGDVIFARASSLVNEVRSKATDLLCEKSGGEAETDGYQLVVDKKIEWGIIDETKDDAELTAAGRWLGTSGPTLPVRHEKIDQNWKKQSWQPAKEWSSSWWDSPGWQQTQSWQPATAASSSNWQQTQSWQPATAASSSDGTRALTAAASQRVPTDPRAGQAVQQFWGSGARRALSAAPSQRVPKDPRAGQAVQKFWGSGARRSWWE